MLHTRCGNPEMAQFLLQMWPQLYTNKGGRTLHDANFKGFSNGLCGNNRIMQMDAGLGIVAAILDSFLYERNGVLELFGGFSAESDCNCSNIAVPGGMRFSGGRKGFFFTAVREANLTFRFPAGEWLDEENRRYQGGDVFKGALSAGQEITFRQQ